MHIFNGMEWQKKKLIPDCLFMLSSFLEVADLLQKKQHISLNKMSDPNQPHIKYFTGFNWRVLPTILSLEVAGLPYTEERIGFPEWRETKQDRSLHPTNTVPVVTIAGTKICQSVACAKFAAKAGGLEPANPIEAGLVDEVEACLQELLNGGSGINSGEGRDKYLAECLPKWCKRIEDIAKGEKYFLPGDRLTIADFWITAYVDFFAAHPEFLKDIPHRDDFNQFKTIMRIVKNVKAHPAVAAYYARHPGESVINP